MYEQQIINKFVELENYLANNVIEMVDLCKKNVTTFVGPWSPKKKNLHIHLSESKAFSIVFFLINKQNPQKQVVTRLAN